MTVLTALQSAAVKLVSRKPTTFFQSTETLEVELCDLVNDVARDIADKGDWRDLTTLATFTGDGTTVSFDLPSDYDRMLVGQEVHSNAWETWRYTRARDLNEWTDANTVTGYAHPGMWIILGGDFKTVPAIPTGDVAKFYYISSNIVTPATGSAKAAFTADDDSFVLDERLLTLGLVWRWRQQKRLEYAEDMETYERDLATAIARDKGARVIATGPARSRWGSRFSYPGQLG